MFWVFKKTLSSFESSVATNQTSRKKKTVPQKKSKVDIDLLEVYDYHGIKIICRNGVYNITEKGFSRSYPNQESLPTRYKKMLVEVYQSKSNSKDMKLDYNGKLFSVSFPNGKVKKFKRYSDIPAEIRKKFSFHQTGRN